jgi:RNA polymerase sigma-70 factor (ECF subfamily)
VKSIQAGGLDEPERLPGFIRTIVSRQIALRIGNQIAARERKELPLEDQASGRTDFRDFDARSPEKQAIDAQHVGVMRQMLNDLEPREREILSRFYIDEQPKEQIMREMGLNDTQFRLFKSRTKQKFIGQVKDRLAFVTLFRVTETD